MAAVARPRPLPIDPTYTPSVAITKLPATASVEKIIEILDRDGGVIIEDFASQAELDAITTEIQESNTTKESESAEPKSGAIPQIPKETHLVWGLVGRSETVAGICENPTLTALREQILTERRTVNREGVESDNRIDPLLSISISFQIGSGAPRQLLHRDDNVHLITHAHRFDIKKVSQFACLIAACDTTRENGATMFIPGSHRWDDERTPRVDEICFAEMKAGSALIFLGSAYHGGGHNSVPDSHRVVHGLFFVRGYLRQEENQFLAVPRSKVLEMTPGMRTLLGYKKPDSALGIVDNICPSTDLEGVFRRANA